MARNRGRKKGKSKKRAVAKRENGNNNRQASHAIMVPTETSAASLRGGDAGLPIHRGVLTFNPSKINAHDEGDQDVTLLDVSPTMTVQKPNALFDEAPPVDRRGIDIFKVAATHGHLTVEATGFDTNNQRSLEEILADNPDVRLTNLDGDTVAFAARVVRQVVLEATYGFFQRNIPEAAQQNLWDQIPGSDKIGATVEHPIFIPDGAIDLKNGLRTVSDLVDNCIKVLSQNTPVTDQKSLTMSLSQAVTLCDALRDEKRKHALEEAASELKWLMLGLDCKTVGLYRGVNQQLNRINSGYSVVTNVGQGVVEERDILQSMKGVHEVFKEQFRIRFIKTLQALLAL